MSLVTFFSNLLIFFDQVIVPLIFAVAFLTFLWGIYEYFIAGGADEEKRKQGRMFLLYSLIGFFAMISVWGLVNLLLVTFNLNNSRPDLPSSIESCNVQLWGICVD